MRTKHCRLDLEGFTIRYTRLNFRTQISKNFKKATSLSSPASYHSYKHPYSINASRDEEDYASPSDDYGDSYKSVKPEYGSHGHGASSPGATYYYQQPSAQYMMPYNNHNHHSSHHSQSMVYQPVPYQTPYTSSYSPGGSNSDFTENPAMYYVKQSYLNYPSHNSHHSNSHSNSSERNYSHSSSDPSVVPSALQPTMSYNGKKFHSTHLCFTASYFSSLQYLIYRLNTYSLHYVPSHRRKLYCV
jgi:hypothetical protein